MTFPAEPSEGLLNAAIIQLAERSRYWKNYEESVVHCLVDRD